jgi:hypothetical protein
MDTLKLFKEGKIDKNASAPDGAKRAPPVKGATKMHPQAQVETGLPVGIDFLQLVGLERCALDRRASGPVGGDCSVIAEYLLGSAPFAFDRRSTNSVGRARRVTNFRFIASFRALRL